MKKLITLLTLAFCLNGKAQIITTVAGIGLPTSSDDGYSGDGGQATAALLASPSAVIFDTAGNMYISDQNNSVIRKVNTAGIITTFAGRDSSGVGIAGYNGDGGQATNAELNSPSSVTIDAAGNLYIADWNNNRIRKVNTAGIITTIAGTGLGAGTHTCCYGGDGGLAIAAELNDPFSLAFDAAGNLFVADGGNNRIRKINTAGIISTIAGNGTQGYSGDGGAATAAELHNAAFVTLDATGNLYITDNSRIRKINTSGIISTFCGNGTMGFSGDGGQATNAEFTNPAGLVFDAIGNLYISDYSNFRIRKVNTAGIISTIAGNGTFGYSGDGGLATAAEFRDPAGITLDAAGNLYIADDFNNCIRKICFSSCTTTDIEQFASINEQVNIYPNPNNGSFVIEPSSTTKQTVQLYDVNGKLVLSQSINGKTNIDANILNEGVYNISLQSNEGVVNKRLVIVR